MASPNFKINGNPVGVPASVGASSTVTATLDSTDGVRQVEWSIASTDETTAIGDYTLVQSGSIGQTVTTTALVAGTAARLRCRINGGVNLSTGLNDPNGTNAYGKFGVLTAAGYMVGCVGETTEQDATSGWAKLINPIIRVAPSAAPVTSVTGTAPIVSSGGTTPAISITAASGVAAGSMSAAHYTLVNDATSAATANTIALRGSSSESAFGYLYSGGSLPTTGFLRHASGFTYIASTTAAGGFDNAGFTDDGADGWKVGNDTRAAAVRLSVKTGGSATVEVNNVVEVTMDATGINLASGNTYQVNGVAHTALSTASSIMFRDAAGRSSVADPSASTDIATKNYVDTGPGRMYGPYSLTITHADLTAADIRETINFASALPANARIAYFNVVLDTPFSGGGASTVLGEIGRAGVMGSIGYAIELFGAAVDGQASTTTNGVSLHKLLVASTTLQVQITSDVNVVDLTAGSATFEIFYTVGL